MDIAAVGSWFVCGLGATVFAASAAAGLVPAAAFAGTFILTAWWVGPSLPSAPLVGTAAAVGAWLLLVRARRPIYPAALAGVLAGSWTGVLDAQGVPAPLSIVLAAGIPVLAATLRARRPTFAPPALRDEALLLMVVLGLVVAVIPGVHDGWRAAGNLNLHPAEPRDALVPTWAFGATLSAAVCGGLYASWSRR